MGSGNPSIDSCLPRRKLPERCGGARAPSFAIHRCGAREGAVIRTQQTHVRQGVCSENARG
eukprot:scaffold1163_cov370-Pavlova_lutheri.AAC.4